MPPTDPIAEKFRAWVLDPARTNDELLPVVYLVSWGRMLWGQQHKDPQNIDYDAARAERKRRRLNPASRPVIDPQELTATLEVWSTVTKLATNWGAGDRPVRSLAALCFLPQLWEVSLAEVELPDLSPLAGLPNLRTLDLAEPVLVGGYVTTDFSPIAGLPIEKLSLSLRHPLVDFSVVATLPRLREVMLRTNLIALETLPSLPAAEIVSLEADFRWKTPARSFHALPEMPRVQRLKVASIANLEGAERLREVRNLDLAGPFADLTPLAALPQVTFLRLESAIFTDLAPLARMPALRELLIVREVPFDLGPLVESASLRLVRVERCDIVATELAALNAALDPDEDDFLASTPRTLSPDRFFNYRPQDEEITRLQREFPADRHEAREQAYGADEAIGQAEARWGSDQVRLRLNRLLGGESWGGNSGLTAGSQQIRLRSQPAILRLSEIVQELREFSARSRFPWHFTIEAEPPFEMGESMEEIAARDEPEKEKKPGHWLAREFDPEQERQDHEEFAAGRREEYQRLEAEHLHRLKEEQAQPIDPEDFAPAPSTEAAADETDPAEEEDDETADGGFIADFLDRTSFIVGVTEEALWVTDHMRAAAEQAYGEPAEDWHSLPQSIEERPRPA